MAQTRARLHPLDLGAILVATTLLAAGLLVAATSLATFLVFVGAHPRTPLLKSGMEVALVYTFLALVPITFLAAATARSIARRRTRHPLVSRPVLGATAMGAIATVALQILLIARFPLLGPVGLPGGYMLWLVALPALFLGLGAWFGVWREARKAGLLAGR